MKLIVGLDVSLAKTSICVISEHGQIIKEAETESEPEVLARWFDELDGSIAAIGLEAGPLSQWLHRGLPAEKMYATIEAELGLALPADFGDRVKRRVLKKYRTELKPIDGVEEVLSSINTKKCVASSSNPAKLALGLVETGLFELVYPNVLSTALVQCGKPHPDLFLYSANAMGVAVSNCIVVEDSVAGVTAAKAAGMRSIGFVGGAHCSPSHSEKLASAGAETVIDDIRELLHKIENHN